MSFWKKAGWVGVGVLGVSAYKATKSQTKYNKKALELLELEVQERKLALQERQKMLSEGRDTTEYQKSFSEGRQNDGALGVNVKYLLINTLLCVDNGEHDMEIAKEKDDKEYEAFKSKLNQVDKYLSDSLISSVMSGDNNGVDAVFKSMQEFFKEGHNTFMFKSHIELEDEFITNYLALVSIAAGQLPADKKDEFFKSHKKILDLESYVGLLRYLDLAGKLDTGDKERAWLVLNPQVVSDYIAMFKPQDAIKMAKFLRDFMSKIVGEDRLEKDDFNVTEGLIQEGLERNAKFGPLATTFG